MLTRGGNFLLSKIRFTPFVCRELKLNGISTLRDSLQMGGVKKEAREITEVTCDKASLTKHKYVQSQLFHTCLSNCQGNHLIFKPLAFRIPKGASFLPHLIFSGVFLLS